MDKEEEKGRAEGKAEFKQLTCCLTSLCQLLLLSQPEPLFRGKFGQVPSTPTTIAGAIFSSDIAQIISSDLLAGRFLHHLECSALQDPQCLKGWVSC